MSKKDPPTPEELKQCKSFLKDHIGMWQRIDDRDSDEFSKRHLREWKKHLEDYNNDPHKWKKANYFIGQEQRKRNER